MTNYRGLYAYIKLLLVGLVLVASYCNATNITSLPFHLPTTICELDDPQLKRPDFTEPKCQLRNLIDINPQNKAIWVKVNFDKPEGLNTISQPLGFYLFGKAASRVYLNDVLIGNNGEPAADKSEVQGKMDYVFAVPEGLLKAENNRLTLLLSGQHSVIHLNYPMHMFGFGAYGDPKRFIQHGSSLGLMLAGAFTVGALYFFILSIGKQANQSHRLFSLLCLIAALQLGAEISRTIVSYDYQWQDFRLIAITVLSFIFGIIVLIYSSKKVAGKQATHWIYVGILLSILTIITVPGFDNKTAAGILIPLFVGVVQLFTFWLKTRKTKLIHWFVVQLSILFTIVLTAASFHEIIYFIIISILLLYLFVQQAREYSLQQEELQVEKSRLAKLEYKLSQNAQTQSPVKIEISVAGNTEYVLATDIIYCKAAGDYAEIYISGQPEKLYSGSLKELEAKLPDTFIRVHRSYVVNLDAVTSLSSSQQSAGINLSLNGGFEVPVSRRLLTTVKQSLKENMT